MADANPHLQDLGFCFFYQAHSAAVYSFFVAACTSLLTTSGNLNDRRETILQDHR